jgi:hypothetical protein
MFIRFLHTAILQTLLLLFSTHLMAAQAKLTFLVKTNMPGISVKGELPEKKFSSDDKFFEFDVFELKTGMEERDKHMYEKVFSATEAGQKKIRWELREKLADTLLGELIIGDKKVSVPLNLKDRLAQGKVIIRLTDYTLPRPSFMGVKVADEVEITYDIQGL